MASIFKKPGSPFWFAAFRGAHNQRCQRTTKKKDRSEAMTLALEWERVAESGRDGVLTEAACRKVIGEILERTTGEKLHFRSCKEWLEEWIAAKQGAPATLAIYRRIIESFLEHLGTRAALPLGAISPKDVRTFRDSLTAEGRSARTVNNVVSILGSPFHAARKLGYINMNPVAAVEALSDDEEGGRDVFTPEQLQDLLKVAEGNWKGVILTGYFTGLRLTDITELTWSAVDLAAGVLKVRPKKTRKTLPEITIPIHPELAEWLAEQESGIGKAPIFPELAGQRSGGSLGLSLQFSGIMEKAGIVNRVVRQGGGGLGRTTLALSFHALRHSFNSALANLGVAQEIRQQLTGHKSSKMNAKYTHHQIEPLREAIAKMGRVQALATA